MYKHLCPSLAKKLSFCGKVTVSAGLLAYLAYLIDWQRALTNLREADKVSLLIVPLVSLGGFLFASARWRLILSDNHVTFPGRQAYRGYLLGLFYGYFLPGVLGGDAVRIGLCVQRTKCDIGTATAAIFLERISGITALFVMAFLVYLFFPAIASALLTTENTRLIPMIAVVAIIAISAGVKRRDVWVRRLPKESSRGVWSFVRSGMLTFSSLKSRTLGSVLILSAIFQASNIIAIFFIAQAMNLNLPLAVFFAVMPIVYVATILPFSLGGLGVREGTLVFLLSRFGILSSDAVTLSFLVYLNCMVIGILGGSFHFIETLAVKFLRKERWNRA